MPSSPSITFLSRLTIASNLRASNFSHFSLLIVLLRFLLLERAPFAMVIDLKQTVCSQKDKAARLSGILFFLHFLPFRS